MSSCRLGAWPVSSTCWVRLQAALWVFIVLTGCAGVLPLGASHPQLGQVLSLPAGAETERGRALLILLWSTSCERCSDWAIRVEPLSQRGRLAVLGVLSHSELEEAQRVVTALSLSYAQLLDPDGVFMEGLGLKRVPVLLWVDASGALCFVSRERTELDELERVLVRLEANGEHSCR